MTPCKINCSKWGLQSIKLESGVGCAVLSLFSQERKRRYLPGQVPASTVSFIFTRPLIGTMEVHQLARLVVVLGVLWELNRNRYDSHWSDFTSP